MKFSRDTSRLVEGRLYWCVGRAGETPEPGRFCRGNGPMGSLWGDEVVAPTVEVEPERAAWMPPVCPAGQFYLDARTGEHAIAWSTRPLEDGCSYPAPAWPPRIGEIVEVRRGGGWTPSLVLAAPDSDGFVTVGAWSILADEEGETWRWVYRDLSDYTPPGGAP